MYNSVLISVALCLTSLVLGENIPGDKEKQCTLLDQSRGVCKPSSECHGRSTSSIICSSQRDIVYVCCQSTTSSSASYVSTGETGSRREEKQKVQSKTGNVTGDGEISDRFFYGNPIVHVAGSWQNKGSRGEGYTNYNNNNEGWNSFRDRDVYTVHVEPVYEFEYSSNKKYNNPQSNQWTSFVIADPYEGNGGKEQENVKYTWYSDKRTTERPYNPGFNYYEEREDQKYPWNSNRQTTQRPYNQGYNNYEENEDQKYPWNSNRQTTQRPYNQGYNNYEEKEDQKYPWNSNRQTTQRPYNPGYNNYEEKEDQKYPWNSNRQTTQRPYNPGYNNYEEKEDQKYPWNSNRRTTQRPYNPGYNNYEEKEDQKYPWNSNRQTTQRPYNEGYINYEEKEDEKYPWNSDRRTTERPYNPGYNNYEEKEDQKYPWNSHRQTTQRPYNEGYINYEEKEDEKYPWNSDRRTTERPYNPGYNNYEEKEDQKYPWNSNRRTTERPRTTRRTTESSNKKRKPVSNNVSNSSGNQNRKRISEIKCEEYSEPVTQTISGLPLLPNPSPIEIKVDECEKFQSLIVGGKNTSVGEFPHMVAVGFFDAAKRQTLWHCGGSLVSEQYVLSAAHCASSNFGKPVKVRLGEYNLKEDEDGAYPEDYPIAEIIVHPDYKQSTKYNDIALFKLSRRVNIRKNIRPACLQTKPTIRDTKAIAVGWGRTERAGEQSDILQKVSLNIINKDTCRNSYTNVAYKVYLPRGIIDTQICAGELTGNKDTCQGDSGGPLEVLSESNRCIHYIIGITSFGKACAAANSPGVYTRVSSYISWIESIVWPLEYYE